MQDEGIIKFNCEWIKAAPPDPGWLWELNEWRDILYKAGLVGVNQEGIGYGNLSVRFQGNQFIITGSTTGKIEHLSPEHYTLVTDYDLDKNSLTTTGPIRASSESLTHAIMYESDANVNAVLHVHHYKLWKGLLRSLPSTGENIEYGTTAMAREIYKMMKDPSIQTYQIFAMAGHEEGILAFGKNLPEAGNLLLEKWKDLS
jgi:L-ribulose-5-phosphate 4-epimerase